MEPGSVSNLSSRNINPVNRQRTAEARENKSESKQNVDEDTFEPSSELASQSGAQETETAEAAKAVGREVNSGRESQVPIQDQDEALAVVQATTSQILGDIAGASYAQGNLDGDTVLDLTA